MSDAYMYHKPTFLTSETKVGQNMQPSQTP
jgi:hypothetical protein